VPIGRVIEDAIRDSVDRNYSFQATANGEYVVFLKSLDGLVVLGVRDSATQFGAAAVFSSPGALPLDENPTPNFVTPLGGVQLIRVRSLSGRTARFQFMVFSINTAPEIAPSRFAFGDTVASETIDPVADADWFDVHGEGGQTIAAIVEPLGGSDSGGVTLYVENPATGQPLALVPAAIGDSLMTTGPIILPAAQDYRFVVRSTSIGSHPRHRGSYRFWSHVIHPAPEHLAAEVLDNVEMRGERIDHPNDVDEFTFQDTVGAEFNAFLESSRPFMLLVVSPTNSTLGARVDHDADTALFHHGTGPFQLTASGTHTIRVETGALPWLVADTGAYRFILYRIDHRPESVPSVVQVGDTISGEAIQPAGDVDEFTVAATPGESLTSWFRLSADPVPHSVYLSFEVLDPSTGALLGRILTAAAGDFVQGATFSVPASGAVQIRIGRIPGGEAAAAPYEFFFGPPPPVP